MVTDVDRYVASRVRRRRRLLGLTQMQLAEKMGIQFQLIQKYETAKVRLYASRLHQLSVALEVPISYFFEGFQKPS